MGKGSVAIYGAMSLYPLSDYSDCTRNMPMFIRVRLLLLKERLKRISSLFLSWTRFAIGEEIALYGALCLACFPPKLCVYQPKARAVDSLLHLSRLRAGQRLGTSRLQSFLRAQSRNKKNENKCTSTASAFGFTHKTRAPTDRWRNVRLRGSSAASKRK